MSKLPPFSKPLAQCLAQQIPPTNDVYLFIGKNAWDKAKLSTVMRPNRTICLPPNTSPFSYDWPVAMCDILIIDTSHSDEELIDELTSILFKSSAVIVRYIDIDGNITVFKRN